MGRTAPLTSERCILYIYSTNTGTEYFKLALYSPFFSSSKCSFFHNTNLFGSCIIHILYTGCATIKKNNSGAKSLIVVYRSFDTICRTSVQGSSRPLLVAPIGCVESSVIHYRPTPGGYPEDGRPLENLRCWNSSHESTVGLYSAHWYQSIRSSWTEFTRVLSYSPVSH